MTKVMYALILYGSFVSFFYNLSARIQNRVPGLDPVTNSILPTREVEQNSPPKQIVPGDDPKALTRFFEEEIELLELLGEGDVSFAFKANYRNKTIAIKIGTDRDLYFSDLEIDFLRVLQTPPTIPTIPKLHFFIRSMTNPYFAASESVRKHMIDDLGVKKSGADWLALKRRISLIGIDLLTGKREPQDVDEVRRFTASMLETLQFAHSRNIIHCDLHNYNYYWDGNKTHFFDWNAAFFYEPNKIPIHHETSAKHLFPPEAQKNKSAVHTSVYAFDVYTAGKLMQRKLDECCDINKQTVKAELKEADEEKDKNSEKVKTILVRAEAYEAASFMMLSDPYQRPDAATALRHTFFGGDLTSKKYLETLKKMEEK